MRYFVASGAEGKTFSISQFEQKGKQKNNTNINTRPKNWQELFIENFKHFSFLSLQYFPFFDNEIQKL